jgi:hypothetical protein
MCRFIQIQITTNMTLYWFIWQIFIELTLFQSKSNPKMSASWSSSKRDIKTTISFYKTTKPSIIKKGIIRIFTRLGSKCIYLLIYMIRTSIMNYLIIIISIHPFNQSFKLNMFRSLLFSILKINYLSEKFYHKRI